MLGPRCCSPRATTARPPMSAQSPMRVIGGAFPWSPTTPGGLDYAPFRHPHLPQGALAQGADLAIGSVHKTLTGLAQTSVLSIGSDRIDTERLQLSFELEESTSASSLLLSSIDGARRQFVRDGKELLSRAVSTAHYLRAKLATEVPELPVVSLERLAALPGVAGTDPTHVLIETAAVGLTGFEADDWLRDERQIDVELVDHRRVMPLVTFAHDVRDADRLVQAVRDLVDERGQPAADSAVSGLPSRAELRCRSWCTHTCRLTHQNQPEQDLPWIASFRSGRSVVRYPPRATLSQVACGGEAPPRRC